MRLHAKLLRPVLGVVAIAAFAAIGVGSASAKPGNGPSRLSSGGCPSFNAYEDFYVLHNVNTEIREAEPGTFEYLFAAAIREEEAEGVPGLIKYCVYPPTVPNEIEATFDNWVARQSAHSPDFSFDRPEGNPTNLPLSGEPVTVGTAMWEEGAPSIEE